MIKQSLFITPIILFSWFLVKSGGAVTSSSHNKECNIKKHVVKDSTELYYCQGQVCEDIVDFAISKIPKIKPLLSRQSYKQRYCLAQNIYHESRTEPLMGQVLVAKSTISRVLSKEFPNSICGVVYQKNQMSWTKFSSARKKKIPKKFIELADKVLHGRYGIINHHYTNWFNVNLDGINTHNARILTGRKKGFELVSSFSIPNSSHIFISYKRSS